MSTSSISRRSFVAGTAGTLAASAMGTGAISALASVATKYIPGTYTATAHDWDGDIDINVTFSEDAITDIAIKTDDSHTASDDALSEISVVDQVGWTFTNAIELLRDEIVENQSLAVDSITGASVSSPVILDAVADAVAQAGGDPEALKAVEVTHETQQHPDEEYDVVIIGAGGSGMSAALEISEAGDYSILMLEKEGYTGGASALSGGYISVSGVPEKEVEGVLDFTTDEYVDYFKRRANEQVDRPEDCWVNESLIRRLADKIPSYYPHLMELGIDQQLHVNTAYFAEEGRGITVWRHPNDAAYNWGLVLRKIVQDAGVEIRCNSKVTELIVENGGVAGVMVETPYEGTYAVKAKKVLVACGGFDSNLDLFRETFADTPYIDTVWTEAAPGATGDAFDFCAPLDPAYRGYGFAKCASVVPPYHMESKEGNYPIFGCYLWVDKTGKRFVDETEWYYQKAEALLQIEDGYGYSLCSGDLYADGHITIPTETFVANLEAHDGIVVADTIEELAEKAGFDLENLKKSIAEDEMRVNGGKLDTFGARLQQAMNETGPYYAIKLICSSGLALYGFELEEGSTHMINTTGDVIPNLFASGEVAIGNFQFGQYAFMGSAITWAIMSGALAGEDIAAELSSSE